MRSSRGLSGLLIAGLVAGACSSEPVRTPPPSGSAAAATPAPALAFPEHPFAREAWPEAGSACDLPGYTGRLGRVEAVSARMVRFTLCAPDGAFLARLAHPALGVIDAAAVDAVAADPAAARTVAGAGSFRVAAWTDAEVRLERVSRPARLTPSADPAGSSTAGTASQSPVGSSAAGSPPGPPPVIVMRWAAVSADRTAALMAAVVDGIDAPSAADTESMGAMPEIGIMSRPGLATAYLGFGTDKAFAKAAVRRAFAQALDHAALATEAFPVGSMAATTMTPCVVLDGCAGTAWYDFNGPAAAAALAAAGYDTGKPVTLHIPDGPVPGIPNPAALAAAIRDELAGSIGVTVTLDVLPAADLAAAVATQHLGGLYVGGIASSLADPSGYLEPLFGAGSGVLGAARAEGVTAALADAARTDDPTGRHAAFGAVNDAIRLGVPLVPLVHPGSTAAYRVDVPGVTVSPFGTDPLGSFVPGDRRQLVVMGTSEPAGAWCGTGGLTTEALRLCALVTPGLYAFDGASVDPVPALATGCTASGQATVWTCRLRGDVAFTDGRQLDAGDVLAVVRAQADTGSALRSVLPTAAFTAWDELFGGPLPAGTP